MKLHPCIVTTTVAGRELGVQLGKLRYDLLNDVIMGLTDEIGRQAFHDGELGRTKLSRSLQRVEQRLVEVEELLADVLHICEPYIQKEKALGPANPQQGYADIVQRFTSFNFRL